MRAFALFLLIPTLLAGCASEPEGTGTGQKQDPGPACMKTFRLTPSGWSESAEAASASFPFGLTLPAGPADVIRIPIDGVPEGYRSVNVSLYLRTTSGTEHLYPQDVQATVFVLNLTNINFPNRLPPGSETHGWQIGYRPSGGRALAGYVEFMTTFLVDPVAHDLAIVSGPAHQSTLTFDYCDKGDD